MLAAVDQPSKPMRCISSAFAAEKSGDPLDSPQISAKVRGPCFMAPAKHTSPKSATIMRTLLTALAAIFATASLTLASELWTRDMEAAKTRAKAEEKPIFLYFTGSDWCGWCKKMEKEILTQKEFLDYAKENLILVELDYPRSPENKAKQSEAEREQNKALDKKFKIEGYPTIYLVDAEGELLPGADDLAKTKYHEKGPAGFAAAIRNFLAEKPKTE
jgi:protein disulfide-isomerase